MTRYLICLVMLGAPLLGIAQTPTIPYSVTDICQNEVGIYSVNPNGCTFNYWEWAGQATVQPPTTTQSLSIHLRWQASGTLYANCTCPDQYGNPVLRLASVDVAVATPVSISAYASPTSISLGQQVLLSAEGASNYQWVGEGLQTSSGNLVAAVPISGGVKNYSVTSFSGNNNVCQDTENVVVTVVAPILNIQVERCRESGDVPLASLGLSLQEGNWSGPGIVGESIQISGLTNNVEYAYQYIRTSDSAPGHARITIIETVAGGLSVNPTSSCEGNLSGSITIQNNQGNIHRWQQYNSQTGEWQTNSNTSGPLQYQTTSASSFRAIVKKNACIEKPTDPVHVNPVVVSVGQINTASISIGCETITGSLSVSVQGGGIAFWESSNDGVNNWLPIPSSATATLAGINKTSKTYYRAAAQYANCSVKKTGLVNFEPLKPIAGYLNPSALTINCGSASGTLVLQNSAGSYEWQQNTGNGWFPIEGQTNNTYDFATNSAIQYRVRVSRNQCTPVFSNVYSINVTSSGGSTYMNSPNQCGNATGNIQLYDHVGEIHHWEKSMDQVNWSTVDGSQGVPSLAINTSAPTSYYRAVVTLGNCAAAYSTVTTVTVSAQPVPGVVRFAGETQEAQMINGQLTFYPRFILTGNIVGSVQHWEARTLYQTEYIGSTALEITRSVTQTTGFRAQIVNSQNCPALLSGEATMVVNRLYEGVQSILGNEVEIVTAYDGHSYEVKNTPGISIQDGFSFHANTAQEFFILLDDNYAYPPVNENYVWEETILREALTEKDKIYFSNANERQGNYTYYDGLGRAIQHIAHKASPTEKDIVTPIQYDPVGRIEKEFLPFESATGEGMLKADAYVTQSEFYLTPPEKISTSTHPFSKKIFEQSPLNRVLEQGAPGTDWQPAIGHVIRFKERTNGANEIKRWRINHQTQVPGADGYYSVNELDLQETIDEHGNSVKQYIDKQGLLIEKHVQFLQSWLRTIYLYDDLGLLRYVIQPEGAANLAGDPNQNFLDTWAFQYKYDKRKRMVEKRVPGGGWTYYVYDKRDRLAMTQDANQHAKNEWFFTKYDALNRPVMTGIYHCYQDYQNNGQIMSRVDIQQKFAQTGIAEERYNWSAFGYTNSVFPTLGTTVLSVIFYDNYDFIGQAYIGWNNYYFSNVLDGLPNAPSDKVKGLVTGTLTFVDDADEYDYNDIYLYNINWYDSKYRVIQTLSNNHLGGQDRVSMRYDFVGNVVARSHVHSKNQTSHTLLEEFTYDHAGRMLVHSHTLDDQPRVVLKNSSYNALGQLVEANLHLKADGSYQQSVDYRYNIRGWLTHINNASLSDDGGQTNNEANDLFGFELKYNNPDHNNPQFNGNISQVNWKSSGSPNQAYHYTYDPANRLRDAIFKDLDNPLRNGRFNETISAYDRNGNILGLSRTGNIMNNEPLYGTIDQMNYTYQGNRLQQVTDEFDGGFADGNKESDDYTYDGNGNMISDKNKDIDAIDYNFLNLPKVVTKNNGDHVNYTYTALGSKLSQVVTEGETSKTTDYTGQFIYEDNVLQFIQHAEGRITMKDDQPVYEYFLKDHLGNVRVTFTSKSEVEVSRATLEDDRVDEERSQFLNYDNVRIVNSPVTKKTSDFSGDTYFHTHAVRLSGGPNEKIGLAKSLQLMPGDKVHMEVYAKYMHPQDHNYWGYYPNLLMNALAGINPGQIVIDGPSYGSAGFVTPIENGEGSDNEDGPQAYLRYIFVPKDFDFTQAVMQGIKVSTEAREINGYGEHEKLELDFEATEAGYLYAYFCNDREVPLEEVFFDEFKVEHEKSPIVQSNDYYPFGLTFNSYQRESSVDQKYKFQGQEHIDDLDLGWDSFKWRNHMPDIGRFFGIDPLAEKYYYNSPYAFSENKVVAHRELEGLESESIHQKNYIPMAQDVPSETKVHRNGASIKVSSWNGKGEVVNSTAISLPSSSSQSQVSDHSAKTIGGVAMTAGESNPRISSIARDAKGQAEAMFVNGEKPGVGVQGLKNDYGAGGDQVADVYGRAKAMQGLASQFGGTVTNGQVKGMMENKINEVGVSNVTNHAADPSVLQVFDIAPSSIVNKPAMMNAIEGSIGGGGPISKRIFPGPGRSEKAYHIEIPQPKK